MGNAVRAVAFLCLMAPLPAIAGYEAPPGGAVRGADGMDEWQFLARFFAGYDSNLLQVGDADPFFTGRTDSFVGGLSLNGSWTRQFDNGWRAGLAARMDATRPTAEQSPYIPGLNDDPTAYSLFAISPSVFVERDFAIAGMPVTAGASWDFRYETAAVNAAGMTQHGVSVWFETMPAPFVSIRTEYSRHWHDFEVVFPTPSLDDRDGVHDRIAVTLKRELPALSGHVAFGYAFSREDANGSNFDYSSHQLNAEFATRVAGPFHARLRGSVEWRDYKGFVSGFITPPGRTGMTISELELTGVWVIDDNWLADVGVTLTGHDANDPVFSKDRWTFGAGMTRKF